MSAGQIPTCLGFLPQHIGGGPVGAGAAPHLRAITCQPQSTQPLLAQLAAMLSAETRRGQAPALKSWRETTSLFRLLKNQFQECGSEHLLRRVMRSSSSHLEPSHSCSSNVPTQTSRSRKQPPAPDWSSPPPNLSVSNKSSEQKVDLKMKMVHLWLFYLLKQCHLK